MLLELQNRRCSGLGLTDHLFQALLCNKQERKQEAGALPLTQENSTKLGEFLRFCWVLFLFQWCEKWCVSCDCPVKCFPFVHTCSTQREIPHSGKLQGKLRKIVLE